MTRKWTDKNKMNKPALAAENFISQEETIAGIETYGQGIIHDTYLAKPGNTADWFILQRINTQVFKNPEAVRYNLRLVCEHIRKRMLENGSHIDTNWQMMQPMPARDGRDFFIDAEGNIWRALSFIRGARPLEQISSLDDAREAGRALGTFHFLTSDLDPELLHDALPGFHNVEQYLKHYDAVAAGVAKETSEAGKFCQQFVADRRSWAPVLENGRCQKKLQVRVIHGDPKINNIMLDRVTGRAVSMIDLDTVMPGLVHYDIGDCLRSCCNTRGEETSDFSAVRFDPKRCAAVLSGYTEEAHRFLKGPDFDFLFDAIRLIPFELGLRFYTDFLEGNVYFKASRATQNLDRAMVQFMLVQSIEEQEERLRAIVKECRAAFTGGDSG